MKNGKLIFIFLAVVLWILYKITDSEIKGETVTKKYKYYDIIQRAAYSFGIPANRIFAHMIQESGGNPNCVGKLGERGLMQIMPAAFADVKKYFPQFSEITYDDLWNPEINIMIGAAYLSLLYKWTKYDLDLASRAYNVGIGTIQQNPLAGSDYLAKIKTYEAVT